MTSQSRRIPDSLLEHYLADALDARTRAQLEETMASSPLDQARLRELRADSAAFLTQHPSGPLVERFRQQRQRRQWWRRWPVLIAPVAAAVAIAVWVFPRQIDDPDILAKGPPILVVYARPASHTDYEEMPEHLRPFRVTPDRVLIPGDSISFDVRASSDGFFAVLGLDAKGVVTVYHPWQGTAAKPYDAAQPSHRWGFELDDTLGREDVYVLHSTQPFELEWAIRALKEGRDLKSVAPKGISVGSTFFMKAQTRQDTDAPHTGP